MLLLRTTHACSPLNVPRPQARAGAGVCQGCNVIRRLCACVQQHRQECRRTCRVPRIAHWRCVLALCPSTRANAGFLSWQGDCLLPAACHLCFLSLVCVCVCVSCVCVCVCVCVSCVCVCRVSHPPVPPSHVCSTDAVRPYHKKIPPHLRQRHLDSFKTVRASHSLFAACPCR